jgi:uncharacterized damage-inducible protein DinB
MGHLNELLVDAFDRVRETVHHVVEGLDAEQLAYRPDGEANPVGWLVWHLTRIQDDHIADASGTDQVWITGGWAKRLDLPFDDSATGFGHTADEVAAVRTTPDDLLGYHDAVNERTVEYLHGLEPDDLNRIVDPGWNPPVTLAVRLVSIVNDDMQHAGQAAYVRGLIERKI